MSNIEDSAKEWFERVRFTRKTTGKFPYSAYEESLLDHGFEAGWRLGSDAIQKVLQPQIDALRARLKEIEGQRPVVCAGSLDKQVRLMMHKMRGTADDTPLYLAAGAKT